MHGLIPRQSAAVGVRKARAGAKGSRMHGPDHDHGTDQALDAQRLTLMSVGWRVAPSPPWVPLKSAGSGKQTADAGDSHCHWDSITEGRTSRSARSLPAGHLVGTRSRLESAAKSGALDDGERALLASPGHRWDTVDLMVGRRSSVGDAVCGLTSKALARRGTTREGACQRRLLGAQQCAKRRPLILA